MNFDSIALDWQIIVKSRLRLYDQLCNLLPDSGPETREKTKEILAPLLSALKQKEKWPDPLSARIGELILDDFFAWGPLTHVFKDEELEQVIVHDFARIHCLWMNEVVHQMLPFSLMLGTYRKIIAEMELKLGHQLSSQNPIGIVRLNNGITMEAAFRDESILGKAFILRRSDSCANSGEKSDLPFAKTLQKSSFATLEPGAGLLKESSRILPALEHAIHATGYREDESRDQFHDRVLAEVLSPVQRQDGALVEFVGNFMKGLGPLEWIVSHPDFQAVTIRGGQEINYRLRSQSADQPDLIFPFAILHDRQLLNIVERLVAPHGYRCDEKYPVVDFMTIDGYRIETGLSCFMDEIFIRVGKVR